MSMKVVDSENFIQSLDLPAGVQPKHFVGMNRYHFKYYGDGFLVLDLTKNYYHLRTREEYLRGVGVFEYKLDGNHPSKPATILNIPYDNTDVFYRLVNYITHGKVYTPDEHMDINIPMKLKNRVKKADGTIKYVCGRCGKSFLKSLRCPECGQLVKE